MRMLALDTSTDWCSVAAGDGVRWAEERLHAREAHSEHLLAMVDRVLGACQYTLATLDPQDHWVLEPGTVEITLGTSARGGLAGTFELEVAPHAAAR